MRLTSDQILSILGTALRLSGEDAVVYLFGSRLDDWARGGDVDLLIETTQGLTTQTLRGFSVTPAKHLASCRSTMILPKSSRPLPATWTS
jgi:hypothetical protein